MTIKPGEFWLAEIVFTDGSASKRRPVLVLWVEDQDVVVAVVTSAQPRIQTDVLLKDWATSGLRVESTVRLARLDSLEKTLLLRKLGKVSKSDAMLLKDAWNTFIKLQF